MAWKLFKCFPGLLGCHTQCSSVNLSDYNGLHVHLSGENEISMTHHKCTNGKDYNVLEI